VASQLPALPPLLGAQRVKLRQRLFLLSGEVPEARHKMLAQLSTGRADRIVHAINAQQQVGQLYAQLLCAGVALRQSREQLGLHGAANRLGFLRIRALVPDPL